MSTRQTGGLWTMTKGEFEESVAALERAIRRWGGDPKQIFDLMRVNNIFLDRLAKVAVSGGVHFIDLRLARFVLGRNIFDWADWAYHYRPRLTEKYIRKAEKFPWNEDVLNSPCPFVKGKLLKDTHFAFLGISRIDDAPLTVAKWLKLCPVTGQPRFRFSSDPWHVGQPHTDEATLTLRWYLLLKNIVPNSTDKTPEEQVAMLPEMYEIPTTIAETAKDILVCEKTGERPNGLRLAACTERTVKTDKIFADDVGRVSCVGDFDMDGLSVSSWGGLRDCTVGVGASRKPPI